MTRHAAMEKDIGSKYVRIVARSRSYTPEECDGENDCSSVKTDQTNYFVHLTKICQTFDTKNEKWEVFAQEQNDLITKRSSFAQLLQHCTQTSSTFVSVPMELDENIVQECRKVLFTALELDDSILGESAYQRNSIVNKKLNSLLMELTGIGAIHAQINEFKKRAKGNRRPAVKKQKCNEEVRTLPSRQCKAASCADSNRKKAAKQNESDESDDDIDSEGEGSNFSSDSEVDISSDDDMDEDEEVDSAIEEEIDKELHADESSDEKAAISQFFAYSALVADVAEKDSQKLLNGQQRRAQFEKLASSFKQVFEQPLPSVCSSFNAQGPEADHNSQFQEDMQQDLNPDSEAEEMKINKMYFDLERFKSNLKPAHFNDLIFHEIESNWRGVLSSKKPVRDNFQRMHDARFWTYWKICCDMKEKGKGRGEYDTRLMQHLNNLKTKQDGASLQLARELRLELLYKPYKKMFSNGQQNNSAIQDFMQTSDEFKVFNDKYKLANAGKGVTAKQLNDMVGRVNQQIKKRNFSIIEQGA